MHPGVGMRKCLLVAECVQSILKRISLCNVLVTLSCNEGESLYGLLLTTMFMVQILNNSDLIFLIFICALSTST